AKEGIRSIPDLKGKNVGVQALGSSQHMFLSTMAAYVGLDPVKNINWVTSSSPRPIELFAEGKIDGFLGFPPDPQELHARKIGRVIVNSTIDRPWSQYFCCMLAAHRDYVRKHPIATKRVIRAIAKAADLLRHRADAGREAYRRRRFHRTVRLCAADAQRNPIRKMAGVRSRRHDSVLFATATRSGHDQVESEQNHRRRHGLAILERA
ncbi:MAG: ABC transporter substrate-binding protein, partial [Xanthobacteraceae bacterium]